MDNPRPRPRKVWIAVIIALLVAILALVSTVVYLVRPAADPEISSTTVVNAFEDAGELTVEEYHFSAVGKFASDGYELLGVSVPLTAKSFLITYEGVVRAGVADVETLTFAVDEEARAITVDVPAATVLSTEIDPDSIQQYDQSFNPLNQLQISDVSGFLAAEEKKQEREAREYGLLDRANERVRKLLTEQVGALVQGTNWEDFTITVE